MMHWVGLLVYFCCFYFDSARGQTLLHINIEHTTNASLSIHHENQTENCTLHDSMIERLSTLCPNLTLNPNQDTSNTQLPTPLPMRLFFDKCSKVYISDLEYNGYFCVIELRGGASLCQRMLIDRDEMELCFASMIESPASAKTPIVDGCIASTAQTTGRVVLTMRMMLGTVIIVDICFAFAIWWVNRKRRQQHDRLLRMTYLPIKKRSHDTRVTYKKELA